MFAGIRFHSLNKKLFLNSFGSFGDRKDFCMEANYLFNEDVLLDYTYTLNGILNEEVHSVSLNKIFNKDFQGNIGFKYKVNTEQIFLSLNGKKYFGKNYCVNLKTDLGWDQIVFNTKYKQRISNNFFTIVISNLNLVEL